jgi:signal peptidase I
MNVLIPGDRLPAASGPSEKPPSWWRKPIIPLLLSLLFPGLGQWLNREPRKGLIFALSLPVLVSAIGLTRIFVVFWGLVCAYLAFVIWRIWICIDAFRVGRRMAQSKNLDRISGVSWILAFVIVLCGVFTSTDYYLKKFVYFHAFKVPSASFCPTVCEGEKIVADMTAYRTSTPKRGQVVMFDFQSASGPLYIKRVVGVEGDLVSERDGAILVNGEALQSSSKATVCGRPRSSDDIGRDLPRFKPMLVPPSSFFVVGDNSANSYDSRIEGFGFVKSDQIRGRPLYIYWSPGSGRIGCPVK